MRAQFVILVFSATLGVAAPSRGADIHLFGRLASYAGLGLDSPSVGLESRVQVTDFIFSGMLVGADKAQGQSALFWGADVEWRRSHERLVYGASLSFVEQVTDEFHKSGYFPSLRLGYELSREHTVLLTYRAPDSTENEAWGLGVGLETFKGSLGLIADLEHLWFKSPDVANVHQEGLRAVVAVGWRF